MKKRSTTTWKFRDDKTEVTVTFEKARPKPPGEVTVTFLGGETLTLPLTKYSTTNYGDTQLDTLAGLTQ